METNGTASNDTEQSPSCNGKKAEQSTLHCTSDQSLNCPKYTSRYKSLYMKDYKRKTPLTNRCYNPNTHSHITENFPMSLQTNNRVDICE